jgi:predicted DsbA family dithiol-disulfide isomerase
LEELFAGRNIDIEESQAEMAKLMADEGLPFGERTRVFNSRLAQELAKWAETQPNGKELMRGIYEAYFVDHRNISDVDVLMDVVGKCGLPMNEARSVLESRSFRDAVDRDWAEARAVGVTGVPAFATGRVGVMGAQPYAVLEQLVTQAGAKKRSDKSRQ